MEESTATGLWQEGQTETYPDGPCHSPACPSLRHVSISVDGGWVLKRGVWGADPGRALLLAVRRQPEGMGVRSSATWNAPGGSLDHDRRKAPLLSDMQRAGSPLQPLSSCASPASTGTREGSRRIRLTHLRPLPPLPPPRLGNLLAPIAWVAHSPGLLPRLPPT